MNRFMQLAYNEAKKAYRLGEVPVGCVIVYKDKVIASGYNKRESKKSSLYHAEIIAIKKACRVLKSWRLDECDLYVTLEPCVMCAGAIIQSKIRNVYFGAYEKRYGAFGSLINLGEYRFNHNVLVSGGMDMDICSAIISDFFKRLRKENKND